MSSHPIHLFSTSGTSFLLSELPSLSTDEAALARTIERGPFRGKPSKVIGLTDEEQEGERAAAEAEQAEKEAAELARKEAAEQKAAELAAAAEAAAAAAAEGVESAPPVEPIQTTATEEDSSQPAANPPKPLRISELQRLAFVVRQMDHETALVPKGAFEVTDSRNVISSGNFRGLSFNESRSLSNYRHLRPASEPERLRAQDEAVHMTEFLDGPEEDTPSGCWVMREDAVSGAVSWRSLLWPGYAAFHIPNTFHYGGAYIGNGVRNSDLAFMLM